MEKGEGQGERGTELGQKEKEKEEEKEKIDHSDEPEVEHPFFLHGGLLSAALLAKLGDHKLGEWSISLIYYFYITAFIVRFQ